MLLCENGALQPQKMRYNSCYSAKKMRYRFFFKKKNKQGHSILLMTAATAMMAMNLAALAAPPQVTRATLRPNGPTLGISQTQPSGIFSILWTW